MTVRQAFADAALTDRSQPSGMLATVKAGERGVRPRFGAGTGGHWGETGLTGIPVTGDTPVISEPAGGMTDADAEPRRRFFIVSVSETDGGEARGVVEAVRSGWKERFQGLDELGLVVGALLRRLGREEPHGSNRRRGT
jgi:hypothetical protein